MRQGNEAREQLFCVAANFDRFSVGQIMKWDNHR
jgi:hypothetical protein